MAFSRNRILLVDDDQDTCSAVKLLLNQSGYRVKAVQTPGAALRLAQCERFDLFVLDNHLNDGTGLELCRKIRSFDTATPILIFSGTARECDEQLALAAGAQGFLAKPEGADHLEEFIARLVGF